MKGATRWLDLGVSIYNHRNCRYDDVVLASYLVRRLEEVRRQFSGFVKPMAVVGLIAVLLLLNPIMGLFSFEFCGDGGVTTRGCTVHPISCFWLSTSARSGFLAVRSPIVSRELKRFSIRGLIDTARATN